MITGRGQSTWTADFKVRSHELISGVSEELGGQDEGLDPHELLQAALAACTIITVEMYAKRKEWALEKVEVSVRIDKEGSETHLTRIVSFMGNLTEEQRLRLFEIANKCPVHRLLLSKIEIESQLLVAE